MLHCRSAETQNYLASIHPLGAVPSSAAAGLSGATGMTRPGQAATMIAAASTIRQAISMVKGIALKSRRGASVGSPR